MQSRSSWLPAIVVGLVVGIPVAIWGLFPPDEPPGELDYYMRVDVGPGTRMGLGVAGAVIAVAALVAAIVRKGDQRWWQVLVPLILLGALLGLMFQVMTAGVIGANIGAGLMLTVGLPVAIGLVAWALVQASRLSSGK